MNNSSDEKSSKDVKLKDVYEDGKQIWTSLKNHNNDDDNNHNNNNNNNINNNKERKNGKLPYQYVQRF